MKNKMLALFALSFCLASPMTKSWAASGTPCPAPTSSPIPTTTMESWSKILDAVGKYYGDTEGKFPLKLEDLIPKYLSSIPTCTTPWHGTKTGVFYPSFKGELTNTGQWSYDKGGVGINSKYIMNKDVVTNPYVLRQQLLGTLGSIRSALSIYYADTEGKNPTSLTQLPSKYLPSLPLISVCPSGPVLSGETLYTTLPKTASQVKNTGKWGYVPSTGEVFIDSTLDSLFLK